MYEFTVTNMDTSGKVTEYLFNGLQKQVIGVGGIIIKQQTNQCNNVCLAVEEKDIEYIKAVLLDVIADSIIFYYKYEYLKDNISLNISNNQKITAFLKSLVVFDKQTDKDLIKKSLILDRQLVIDSYYNFRLHEVKERWQSIANVVMESIPTLLQNKSVSEITSYFVSSTEETQEEVHIFAEDNKIKLTLDGKVSDIEFLASDNYQNDLVCEIISLSPKKIILHGKNNHMQELENALSSLFYGKIYRIT